MEAAGPALHARRAREIRGARAAGEQGRGHRLTSIAGYMTPLRTAAAETRRTAVPFALIMRGP
ncbi:hypothetical protein BLAT2472_70250 [Burkholderia latens]